MSKRPLRTCDAPFWAGIVVLAFTIGAFGCIGIAAAEAASPTPASAQIVSVSSNAR